MMNEMEKRAALHAEHHHTKYDWREVYNIPATTPVTHRDGWDDAKQAKLDKARKIVEAMR